MKRYIRSAHALSSVGTIAYILLNVNDSVFQLNINSSEDIFDYMQMSDNQLLELSDDELHSIKDVRIIERISTLDYDRLSGEQVSMLNEECRTKIIVDSTNVATLIKLIKQCDEIYLGSNVYWKTAKFQRKYKLTNSDLLSIVHSISVSDYTYSLKSRDRNHILNDLAVFQLHNIALPSGMVLEEACIYIKIDKDATEDEYVAVVSIHSSDLEEYHPHK